MEKTVCGGSDRISTADEWSFAWGRAEYLSLTKKRLLELEKKCGGKMWRVENVKVVNSNQTTWAPLLLFHRRERVQIFRTKWSDIVIETCIYLFFPQVMKTDQISNKYISFLERKKIGDYA